MAGLVKPVRYDIQDSNIALLGSDLERRVREHAGDAETAWQTAGLAPGLEVWRIEKFHVASWPEERKGTFYDGDSYIVLHTYKKTPDAEALSYDLHFWLGENTSQDEAGTAAYKTVELDDHLHGEPVQYREAQGHESHRFLSYFPHLLSLRGGVASGFHHVSAPPPPNARRLYQISASTHSGAHATHLAVREVSADAAAASLPTRADAAVLVLDLGARVLQLNARASAGKTRFFAADFVRKLVDSREGRCELTVCDEGESGANAFWASLGVDAPSLRPISQDPPRSRAVAPAVSLFRLSDASGSLSFARVVPAAFSALSPADAFLVDASSLPACPAVYVWIGRAASMAEQRLAVQYAQRYLHDKYATRGGGGGDDDPSSGSGSGSGNADSGAAVAIVRVREGKESDAFLHALGGEGGRMGD